MEKNLNIQAAKATKERREETILNSEYLVFLAAWR